MKEREIEILILLWRKASKHLGSEKSLTVNDRSCGAAIVSMPCFAQLCLNVLFIFVSRFLNNLNT